MIYMLVGCPRSVVIATTAGVFIATVRYSIAEQVSVKHVYWVASYLGTRLVHWAVNYHG